MNYEIVKLPARKIVGIGVRTGNDAPDCSQKIGALWERVLCKESAQKKYYGLYTDYQWQDNSYLAVVGTEGTVCASDEVCIEISAGEYARFYFKGNVRTEIRAVWEKIWQMDLPRVYTVDFEEYLSCDAEGQGEVYIYVALGHMCQSCGMPMVSPEQHGTEENGVPSADYCCYCRKNGAFVQDCTMEEMVDFCLQYGPVAAMDKEQAKKQMIPYFATLKRWHKE